MINMFLAETLQTRKESHNICKMMGGNIQPRMHYPGRLLFKFERESSTEKEKPKEFSTTKLSLDYK